MMDGFYERACELHKKYPVVDAHLDLAAEVYYRRLAGEKEVIRRHYLEHFKEGGIRLIVSSVFVETSQLPARGLEISLDQIGALYEDVESVSDEVCIVRSATELQKCLQEGKIAILLYMEGLDVLNRGTEMLRSFYELGVRGASLTWSRRNQLGEGCCRAGELKEVPGGLSEYGIEILKELEERHMFVDVSHLNDDGFSNLAELTGKPFVATHSNARSVHVNYRNLTGEQLKLLGKSGGVVGINAYKEIVGVDNPAEHAIEKMCDHIQFIMQTAGEDCVGIGLDLCDSYYEAIYGKQADAERGDCLAHHGELPLLTAELLRRGVSEEAIRKFLGGNFLRVFLEILR